MKIKTHYSCQNCGYVSAKWLGRCTQCDAWDSMVEERAEGGAAAAGGGGGAGVAGGGIAMTRGRGAALETPNSDYVSLDAESEDQAPRKRLTTGIGELDRVLGGGLVPDSFTLLGGDPGIGKSTLLLQMARGVLAKNPDLKILYCSGEESIDQIRSRARRLGVEGKGRAFLMAETQLERAMGAVQELQPDVLVMDSLQTFSSGYLQSAPGTVSQVREVTQRLMSVAKSGGASVWLVGHVTKEGSIAGPKVVEHMVDTVLYFEGEGGQNYRLLRTVKNRFGSTNELGVFEMDGEGLREVSNPSSLFLSDRTQPAAGTAITASVEGTRPLLVELQALVAPTALAVPRRTAVGMDSQRIALLAAILEKHMGLPLAEQDLFFNVAGGLRLQEPACDLAAAAAIWSSYEDLAFPSDWALVGELGLTGEVRRVSNVDQRLGEARKLGFKAAVIPEATPKQVRSKIPGDIRLLPIERIQDLPELLRGQRPAAGAAAGASTSPGREPGAKENRRSSGKPARPRPRVDADPGQA